MTTQSTDPLVVIADEAAHVAQVACIREEPRDPLNPRAEVHAARSVQWLRHAARGEAPAGYAAILSFVEATIAHRLNPVRYWPLLCCVGQLECGPDESAEAVAGFDTLERRLRLVE